jgi:hypothetical protein
MGCVQYRIIFVCGEVHPMEEFRSYRHPASSTLLGVSIGTNWRVWISLSQTSSILRAWSSAASVSTNFAP